MKRSHTLFLNDGSDSGGASGKNTHRRSDRLSTGRIYRERVEPELKTDARTFHLWRELITDMVNNIVGLLEPFTLYMLSMTCKGYCASYGNPRPQEVRKLHQWVLSSLCEDTSLAPLLQKYITYHLERLVTEPFLLDLIQTLIDHKRFAWVEWLALETKYAAKIRTMGDEIYDGILAGLDAEGYQWLKHQDCFVVRYQSSLDTIVQATRLGNAPFVDYLTNLSTDNRIEFRVFVLRMAFTAPCNGKFFSHEKFKVKREWPEAWTSMESTIIDDPVMCDAFTKHAATDHGRLFLMEMWPLFTQKTREKLAKARFMVDVLDAMSNYALLGLSLIHI